MQCSVIRPSALLFMIHQLGGWRRLSVVGWISLLACGSSPTIAADFHWGVNGHPFNAYPGVSYERQLDYIKDLGLKSYRVDIAGAEAAPALAKLVAEAKTRGISILPVITPGLDLDKETAKSLYGKSYDLAFTLVARFKADIRVWELGNEMENYAIIRPCERRDDGTQYPCEWGPAGGVSMLDYYGPRWAKVSAVLKGLSDGAVAADPTVRKAMGTAGWGHTGAFLRMLADGIRWDISVWHHYEGDPEWAFRFLAKFSRPIWITEFNYAGGSQRGDQQQADGLIAFMNRVLQLRDAYNIEAAHIYELMDQPYWAPSYEATMGLVRIEKNAEGAWTPGDVKPAYLAIKRLIAGGVDRNCDLDASSQKVSNATPQVSYVSYVYCLVLGREPSDKDRSNDDAARKQGLAILQMVIDLVNSDEMNKKYSLSQINNDEFVRLMYRLLLGREPDGHSHSLYASRLDKSELTRTDLINEIVRSVEFQDRHPILFATATTRDKR